MKVGTPVDLSARREVEVKYEFSGVSPSRQEMIARVGVELTFANLCDTVPVGGQCSAANQSCVPNCPTAEGFTCDPPLPENPGPSSCTPVGLSEGPRPKEEERSDLFEIK